jgi:hypothetical protein
MMPVDKEAGRKKALQLPSLGEVTFAVTVALGLISWWLYLTGWTYLFVYYERFRIALTTLDIPREHFFLYGGFVGLQFPLWILAFAAAVAAAIAVWIRLGVTAGWLTLPFSAIILLAAFWLGHQAGYAAAYQRFNSERDLDYSGYDRVQVWGKDTASLPDDSPWASPDLNRGCFRLILHNRDRLFLVRPVKGFPAADLPLVVLPWDQVRAISVMPDNTSCP